MNNLITGDVAQVNLATPAFGQDLARLGQLIDFADLGNLGSPAALLKRLGQLANLSPSVVQALINYGVPSSVIKNVASNSTVISDNVQKAMYQAMTTITGSDLAEVLQILEVTTPQINAMSDLLNPIKLFPSSYQSLSVMTKDGVRGIYLNSQGTVNSNLINLLPNYLINTL